MAATACTCRYCPCRFAVILAFDVNVSKEAREIAEEFNVKIFTADIIYHLFDQFTVGVECVCVWGGIIHHIFVDFMVGRGGGRREGIIYHLVDQFTVGVGVGVRVGGVPACLLYCPLPVLPAPTCPLTGVHEADPCL